MPVPKLECPECGAVLKPSKPVTPGKKVKCPKCGEVFEARGGASEAVRATKKPAARPAAKAPAPKKPAAPAKAAHDDDEGGVYGFVKEPEDERDEDDEDDDRKPDLSFALDLSVKDPRGPAQVKVVRPSNFLIIIGVLEVVIAVAIIGMYGWPLIFSQEWVDPHLVVTSKQKLKEDEAPPPIDLKDLKPEQREQLDQMNQAYLILHVIVMVACLPGLVIGVLIVVGGVKMQQLESYAWAMTACILCIVFGGLLGILVGVMCLMTLNDPGVKEGFRYEKEHRHETY